MSRKIVGLTSDTEVIGPKEKNTPENSAKATETASASKEQSSIYPANFTLYEGDIVIRKSELEKLSDYVGNKLTVNQGNPIVSFFHQIGQNQHQSLINDKKPG